MSTPSPAVQGYFDMSAIFNIEQNYFIDVSNMYANPNDAAITASYLLNLQNQMKNVNSTFKNANTSAENVLTQQQQIVQILNDENLRLEEKQALIKSAWEQNQRIALLNSTYQKQYGQYTKMTIVVVFGLVIFIVLRIISQMFSQVPGPLIVFLHIVNVCVCLILITIFWATLQTRSKINYDVLDLPPPNTNKAGTTNTVSTPQSNLFGICADKSCCGVGTIWDPNTGLCIIPTTPSSTSAGGGDNFTTMLE
jgi:hypothetical protein